MGKSVPGFRSSLQETKFTKLQPSCEWFVAMNTGRSELDSGKDVCGGTWQSRALHTTLDKCVSEVSKA